MCMCLGRNLIQFIAKRLFAVARICGTSVLGGVPGSNMSDYSK